MQGNINIYACGGCGTSILQPFEKQLDTTQHGFATANIFYLDTSWSDLTKGVNHDRVFMLADNVQDASAEEIEGSGQVRAKNLKHIKPQIPRIMHKFQPSNDLNIVVSSASGGSGAVYAACIVEELLKQDKPTIVIMVSSVDTKLQVTNSINALKTYERIARTTEKPVVCSHWQNDNISSAEVVDNSIRNLIGRLRVLFSRQNRKLDKQDLAHFLDYTTTTTAEAKLVYFDVYDGIPEMDISADVISVATIANEGIETKFDGKVEYHTVGYISPEAGLKNNSAWHFCVVDGYAEKALHSLQEQEAAFTADIKARRKKTSLLADNETSTDIFL
jgi:hypothetical protein